MNTNRIVISGYSETPIRQRSGRSAYQLAGEALDALLRSTGIEKHEIDGLSVSNALSEPNNPFYAIFMNDALGLTPTWLNAGGIGGCSAVGGISRAVSAIRDGHCNVAVVISSDAASASGASAPTAFRGEFMEPIGIFGPPATFGLLMSRYQHLHGNVEEALAKVAITQREHAMANPNALAKFRQPLSTQQYFASKMIAPPLRLLDCVMFCDGANAFLVTSESFARHRGLKMAHPTAYSEVTNHRGSDPSPEIVDNGFTRIAPALWEKARVGPGDIGHFQPYDDFTIAVLMQLEAFGFCEKGRGKEFVLGTDLSIKGALPLNTGGGQISAGQPGLAGGGLQLAEAVRQMFGDGGERQVAKPSRALVTGIGGVLYGRNWSCSAAMVLETLE